MNEASSGSHGKLQPYRRAVIGMADQAVSAIGNVSMALGVASQVAPDDFGRYNILFATYLVACGLSRAINSEPMVVRYSGQPVRIGEQRHSATMSGAIVVGLACSTLITVGAVAFQAWYALALLLPLPLLLVQDAVRNALLIDARPSAALLNDSLWTGLQLTGVAFLIWAPTQPLWVYVLTWSASGAIAGTAGMLQLRSSPDFINLRGHLRTHRDLSVRYAMEYLSGSGALQLVNFGIATFAGLTALAAIRGAQVVLGPFNQLLTGLTLVAMPEMVRLARTRRSALLGVTTKVSGASAMAVMIGVALLSLLPDSWGRALLGETWTVAQPVMLPVGVTIAGNMVTVGALLGLRSLADASASLRGRILSAVTLILAVTAAIAATRNIEIIAWSITLAVWFSSGIWWYLYRTSLRTTVQIELKTIAR